MSYIYVCILITILITTYVSSFFDNYNLTFWLIDTIGNVRFAIHVPAEFWMGTVIDPDLFGKKRRS
jgi:hypothetical protein